MTWYSLCAAPGECHESLNSSFSVEEKQRKMFSEEQVPSRNWTRNQHFRRPKHAVNRRSARKTVAVFAPGRNGPDEAPKRHSAWTGPAPLPASSQVGDTRSPAAAQGAFLALKTCPPRQERRPPLPPPRQRVTAVRPEGSHLLVCNTPPG